MIRVSTVLLAAALMLSVAGGVLLWQMEVRKTTPAGVATASVGGPFKLVDQDGHVRTNQDFRGHFVLLYFGYSFCPDACPTTLALMQSALAKLGPQSHRFVPVFVTIDPERDTPPALKTYLSSFGPQFVGLTGTSAEIAGVAREYRVYYAKHPLPGGTYSMDHSGVIYLLDPEGQFVKAYDPEISVATLAGDLKKQL